jgi:hypothetical protein
MPYLIDYNLIKTKSIDNDNHYDDKYDHYIELIVKMIDEYQYNYKKKSIKQCNDLPITKQQLYTIFENKYIYQDSYKYSDKFIENLESSIDIFIQNFCKQI